tara:strand:- start:436 stop:1434 length:999 start_codon:yes stop_codon:yes gene_type:complete
MLTEEQKELRKNLVTASQIGTLMGYNKYSSALDLYMTKKGLVDPFEGNEYTDYGHFKEPIVAHIYQSKMAELGVPVRMEESETLVKGRYGATPDRIITNCETNECWLLEIKTTGNGRDWDEGVPEKFQLQCQWQMMVAGYQRCDICVEYGNGFKMFTLYASEEQQKVMCDVADSFIHCLDNDIEPDASDSPFDKHLLDKVNNPQEDKTCQLGFGHLQEMFELNEKMKADKKKYNLLKNETVQMMESASYGRDDYGVYKVSNKRSKGSRVFNYNGAFAYLLDKLKDLMGNDASEGLQDDLEKMFASKTEGSYRFTISKDKKKEKQMKKELSHD